MEVLCNREVKVWICQVSGLVLGRGVLDQVKPIFVLYQFGVNCGVCVHICQLLVNFLDPTELNPAFHSSLLEHQVGLWVSAHQLQEYLFLETLAVGVGDTGSLVSLCRFNPKQDLIIAKKVRSIQIQVLILVLLAQ